MNAADPTLKSRGRPLLWLGVGLIVLGFAAYCVQVLVIKRLITPWYMPALGTLGVLAILTAVVRRWSVFRLIILTLCGLLVALEWAFLLTVSRTPAYAGPAVGQAAPAFAAQRGDGAPFTDRDLRDTATVLLFFRGHW